MSKQAQVRIIAGQWRGRKVDFLPEQGLRPTSDRVRETVFNWLAPCVVGARCLDLFAGSGALGFEAASRGAESVAMVEHNARVVAQIQSQINKLGADNVVCLKRDALEYLTQVPNPFDIIFLDPPFKEDLLSQCIQQLYSSGCCASGGWIYVEHSVSQNLCLPDHWRCHREKTAGQVTYSLWQTGSHN